MNIIIAGDGEVGFHLAKLLSNENHNITIIDPQTEFIKLIENENNILAVSGDPTSVKILKENNVKRTDLFISVVHDEKTNIITALLAKQLGAKNTIARISNPEFLEVETTKFFKNIGIDHIVCPERIAAEEILSLLNESGATEIVNFSQGQLSLILIKIPNDSPYANKTITEINKINPDLMFRCVAIHRSHKTIIPKDKDIIYPNDLIYMVVKVKELELAIQDAGIPKYPIKNVMIIGGGRIGVKTAQRIERQMNVKLLEIDKHRARRLTNLLEDTLVINADGRDIKTLEEEEIEQMDAFIALTEYSETNIIACLLAKSYGVKRVIALIDNIEFIDLAQNIDIDTTINKKLITASHIAQFTTEAKVASMKCLHGIDAEVMEFVAMPKSKSTKKPIRQIGLPEGAIIGGIVRNKIGYIATGDFQIEPYDNVVVFALPSAYIKVQTLFN
jgi:trk system potassium uptake protein TrkA